MNFTDFEYKGKTSDIDDHALVIVDYENGVKAQFALNMFSEELFEALTVGGSAGTRIPRSTRASNPVDPHDQVSKYKYLITQPTRVLIARFQMTSS